MSQIEVKGVLESANENNATFLLVENLPDWPKVSRIQLDSKDSLLIGPLYELSGDFDGKTLIVNYSKELEPNAFVDQYEYLLSLGLDPFSAMLLTKELKGNLFSALRNPLAVKTKNTEALLDASLEYCKRVHYKELFEELKSFGFEDKDVFDILKATDFKHRMSRRDLLQHIRKNPYAFIWESDLDFSKADAYALSLTIRNGKPKFSLDSEERLCGAIYEVLTLCDKGAQEIGSGPSIHFDAYEVQNLNALIQTLSGSCCIEYNNLSILVNRLLDTEVSDWCLEEVLQKMALAKIIFKTCQNDKIYVYKMDLARSEFYAAQNLAERFLKTKPIADDFTIYRTIEESEADLGTKLSREQTSAVKMALTNPVSVITGGPGTGKSATQKVLLEAFMRLANSNSIRLIAPTGQAAMRMEQATGFPASTIHKALKLGIDSTYETETAKLNEKLILVDEASMIDARLFYKLIQSINKDSTLVIIGDVDQLPSIGAGQVLEQLITSESVPVTRLTRVFRQGDDSVIAQNAAKMKIGVTRLEEGSDFKFVECDVKHLQSEICSLYKSEAKRVGEENVICLTPYRIPTDTGVNELNVALRKAIRDCDENTPNLEGIYLGDKIMYLKNKHGLVNGDIGYCTGVTKNKITCAFRGIETHISKRDIADYVQPAYAQTIHKAQGMEYSSVIMVSDPRHENMNKRNLVYTGVTRAKKCCHIVTAAGTTDSIPKSLKSKVEDFANAKTSPRETFFKAIKTESIGRVSNLAVILDG